MIMQTNANQKEKQSKYSLTLFIFIGLVVIGIIVLMGVWMRNSKVERFGIGNQIPEITMTSFQGESYSLSQMRGKIIVINFWASWCTTCDAESYMLQEVWEEMEPNNDIQFLGVDYVDTEIPALEFINDHGLTYPNCPDLGSKISELFGISGVPETFLIDQDGVLKAIQIGPFDSAYDLRSFIEQAVNQEEE